AAEAPAPPRVRDQRLAQLPLAEVRPERVDEDELRIGELPEQEVRDPQLAGGADQQIRIRELGRVQVRGDRVLVDPARVDPGRDQFSVENAYTVSERTPRSIAASTVRRSARVPARWPATTGRPRRLAQRPFPSMMIATDWATSGSSCSPTGRRAYRVRIRSS